ncbi:hypothetical protein Lalb_Chr20g0114871 [Lupinus albus]|uniref:Uncharacterized protein n=1 Tax=Lupinus albus TaxID=3870 RepID=A0A6A4NX81_LUPAL|nr:hypothetical protein Lalb_Chr20g0114871 [Lupinus albus]
MLLLIGNTQIFVVDISVVINTLCNYLCCLNLLNGLGENIVFCSIYIQYVLFYYNMCLP